MTPTTALAALAIMMITFHETPSVGRRLASVTSMAVRISWLRCGELQRHKVRQM
jgi:hypothetical protein